MRIDEKLAKLDEALDAMSRALASAVSSGEPESKLRGMKDEIVNLCCALQHWRAIKAAHDQHKEEQAILAYHAREHGEVRV